jgi:hypothetical protein
MVTPANTKSSPNARRTGLARVRKASLSGLGVLPGYPKRTWDDRDSFCTFEIGDQMERIEGYLTTGLALLSVVLHHSIDLVCVYEHSMSAAK